VRALHVQLWRGYSSSVKRSVRTAEGKLKKGGRRPLGSEECRRGRRERNPLSLSRAE